MAEEKKKKGLFSSFLSPRPKSSMHHPKEGGSGETIQSPSVRASVPVKGTAEINVNDTGEPILGDQFQPKNPNRKSITRTTSWQEKKSSLNKDKSQTKGSEGSFLKKGEQSGEIDEGLKHASFDENLTKDDKVPLHVVTPEDLPKNLQKVLKQAKLSKEEIEQNFTIVLHVLHYLCKVNFTAIERIDKETEALGRTKPPPPKTVSFRPSSDLNILVHSGNPKELFKLVKEEGKGGFGTVHRAYYKGNEKKAIAIKIMENSTEKQRKYNLAEVSFLKFCNSPKPHPNIVQYIDCYETPSELWLILEYMEGGTLYQAIKSFPFSERQIAYLSREILQGLSFLHSENLVHRDLKSSNVMMTIEGGVKLIDFGLCADISEGTRIGMVGSPYWMAPEMIQRKEYDFKVDIWSLGVCLMELANGHLPFSKNSVKAMVVAGSTGYKDPLEKTKLWSDKFKHFLSSCLTFNPQTRPSSEALLKHEFLQDCDSAKTMKQVISGIFVLNSVLPF